jgi:hypothetical protein
MDFECNETRHYDDRELCRKIGACAEFEKLTNRSELRKSSSPPLTKSEIKKFLDAEVSKVMREVPQRPSVRAARKLRDMFKASVPNFRPAVGRGCA